MKQGESSTKIKCICRNFVAVVFYYFIILSGKGILRAGSGNKKGKWIVNAGYGNQMDF